MILIQSRLKPTFIKIYCEAEIPQSQQRFCESNILDSLTKNSCNIDLWELLQGVHYSFSCPQQISWCDAKTLTWCSRNLKLSDRHKPILAREELCWLQEALNEVIQGHGASGSKQKFFSSQNFWNSWKQLWVTKMSWFVLQSTETAQLVVTLSCISHLWDDLIALHLSLHFENEVSKSSPDAFSDLFCFVLFSPAKPVKTMKLQLWELKLTFWSLLQPTDALVGGIPAYGGGLELDDI